jgi:hypothetical protein
MKRAVFFIALGAIASQASPTSAQKKVGEFEAVKYGWNFSLSQGKALAEKSGKPMMVVMRCVP